MLTPDWQNSYSFTFLRDERGTHSQKASDAIAPALPAPLTAELKLHLSPPTPFMRPQYSPAAWQTRWSSCSQEFSGAWALLWLAGLRCCGCLGPDASVRPSGERQQGQRENQHWFSPLCHWIGTSCGNQSHWLRENSAQEITSID